MKINKNYLEKLFLLNKFIRFIENIYRVEQAGIVG